MERFECEGESLTYSPPRKYLIGNGMYNYSSKNKQNLIANNSFLFDMEQITIKLGVLKSGATSDGTVKVED